MNLQRQHTHKHTQSQKQEQGRWGYFLCDCLDYSLYLYLYVCVCVCERAGVSALTQSISSVYTQILSYKCECTLKHIIHELSHIYKVGHNTV